MLFSAYRSAIIIYIVSILTTHACSLSLSSSSSSAAFLYLLISGLKFTILTLKHPTGSKPPSSFTADGKDVMKVPSPDGLTLEATSEFSSDGTTLLTTALDNPGDMSKGMMMRRKMLEDGRMELRMEVLGTKVVCVRVFKKQEA